MWETGRIQFCSFALCLSLGVVVGCGDNGGSSDQAVVTEATEAVAVAPAEQQSETEIPQEGEAAEAEAEAAAEGEEALEGEETLEGEAGSEGEAPAEEEALSEGEEASDEASRPPPGSEHQRVTPTSRVSRRAIKVTVVEGAAKKVKLVCDGRDLGTKPLGKTRTTLFNAAAGSCHFVFDGKEPARSGRVKSGTHVKCVVKGAVARCK